MELKSGDVHLIKGNKLGSNRTFMELKYHYAQYTASSA